jgi:hypothetical protein
MAQIQHTGELTHKIVNSRYDELRRELINSNAQVRALLQGIRDTGGTVPQTLLDSVAPSGVIHEERTKPEAV